jgi:heat shock protein HspQ
MVRKINAKFSLGQIVHHRFLNYRGVIVDVDPVYQGSDSWYERMAKTRPPKDAPWYYVLVDNGTRNTYVSECNLEADLSKESINHPLVEEIFDDFIDGAYVAHRVVN